MSKKKEAAGICQHLDSLVDELRLRIPAALQEFDENAVHKARVATRRVKASLEMLESVLDRQRSKPFAKLGKKLRRRLGPLRDTDVMLGHLDEIKPDSKLAAGADWLKLRLLKDREDARAKSTNKASASDVVSRLGTWWGIRQDVVDANPAVDSLLAESLHDQLNNFVKCADELMSRIDFKPSPEAHRPDPHQLRIAGKSLRYTLELADVEGHEVPKAVLRTLKLLQEHLGTWHDYVVLTERAMQASIDEDLALHDPATQKQVLLLMDFAMTKAQRELDQFIKLWGKHGSEIAKTIQVLFPLTHPVIVPQTDHGPAGLPPPPAQEAPATSVPPAA